MLNTLAGYNRTTIESLLARTFYYLDEDPILTTLKPIDHEEEIRKKLLEEVCRNLKIYSITDNKQTILDYLDDELAQSMTLDKETEKHILLKLSDRALLPTDLYHVKIQGNFNNLYKVNSSVEIQQHINETIKEPDLIYNFANNEQLFIQKDISIYAKYYQETYSYNNYYMLVIGKRTGLELLIDQAWKIYTDIVSNRQFNDSLELLEIFVNYFGVEVEFREETSKFFLSKIAKDEHEFKIIIKKKRLQKSKRGQSEFVTFHFIKNISNDDKNISLFFVIDLTKYREYLRNHNRDQYRNSQKKKHRH